MTKLRPRSQRLRWGSRLEGLTRNYSVQVPQPLILRTLLPCAGRGRQRGRITWQGEAYFYKLRVNGGDVHFWYRQSGGPSEEHLFKGHVRDASGTRPYGMRRDAPAAVPPCRSHRSAPPPGGTSPGTAVAAGAVAAAVALAAPRAIAGEMHPAQVDPGPSGGNKKTMQQMHTLYHMTHMAVIGVGGGGATALLEQPCEPQHATTAPGGAIRTKRAPTQVQRLGIIKYHIFRPAARLLLG
eukprot:gene13874-biopygen2031